MRKLTTFAQRRTSIQVYSSAAERSKSKIETGEHISNVLARFCAGPWLPVSAWAVGRPVFRKPLPGRFLRRVSAAGTNHKLRRFARYLRAQRCHYR